MPNPPSTSNASAWSLSGAEWETVCVQNNVPRYRAAQILRALYSDLISDWQDARVLPKPFREFLAENHPLDALVQTDASGKSTRKLLLTARDGQSIESVLIPSQGRTTLCVSSQAGCDFGCAFCASGAAGCARDLDAGEIVAQVILASRLLREEGAKNSRPENIVVMGMGEPFANYGNVLKALRILNDPACLGIGARRITVSTCGVVPGIERMAGEGLQFELSVSLHAPDNALRSRLMPVNNRWPLELLLPACRAYTEKTGRIITFEYTLVKNLNDRPVHAAALAKLLRGMKCRVNLIPLSPVKEFDGQTPAPHTCEQFKSFLDRAGINTTLRRSRGSDVDAACGQLRLRKSERRTRNSEDRNEKPSSL